MNDARTTHAGDCRPTDLGRGRSLDCILFDLDGTLVNTIELILASFRHATREVFGHAIPDDALLRNVGIPLRAQMAEFDPDRVDELLAVYRAYNAEVHDRMIREYEGTDEALTSLKAEGLVLGVVTSKSRGPALRGLEVYGLDRHMDLVLTSDDTDAHKPDPTPLLEAARRLDVAPARCAYVGDSPHDMTAARAAGMVAIAALWGPFRDRVLEPGPVYAVETLLDVVTIASGDGRMFRCADESPD
ncbi:MAG: HAD-IA family hydrolase [Coriobacteriales bacterium]|nr:HAD-IA family hydrolase [Coriobacteriales bacterium]